MHYALQDQRRLYLVLDLCSAGDLHNQLSHVSRLGATNIALDNIHEPNPYDTDKEALFH